MNICLVITGSIAAYKSAELARELVKSGHDVQVVMSQGAQKFITPLTLQTLTGRAVATDLWSLEEEHTIGHIRIADDSDLVVVAPASANFIAGVANGFAPDIAQTIVLAARCPKLICPAMNVNMLENQATQQNLATLKSRGIAILDPALGELACGWVGQGRLPETAEIIAKIYELIPQPLKGKSVIVTAGPTRERIDPMRVITNLSSGKTGCEIASAAKRLGAQVTLIAGPGVVAPKGMHAVSYESASDLESILKDTLKELKDSKEITVIMAAAPADYRPKEVNDKKLPKSKQDGVTLNLVVNPDIIKGVAERRSEHPNLKTIVAFAANDSDGLIKRAVEKLIYKKVDFIVANDVLNSVNQDRTELFLIDKQGLRGSSTRLTKTAAAKWLVHELFELGSVKNG